MKEIEIFVKEHLEKITKKPLAMQYRDLTLLNRYGAILKEDNKICDIARGNSKNRCYDIVIKLNSNSAIMKDVSEDPKYKDALYSVIFEGKDTHCLFHTEDHALLGYLEYKKLGSNSQFAEFAYKMLGGYDVK